MFSNVFQALLLANIDALADLETSDVTDAVAGDASSAAGATKVRFADEDAPVAAGADDVTPPLSADGKYVVLRDAIASESLASVTSSASDGVMSPIENVEEPESEA